jgi:hypothetical protein
MRDHRDRARIPVGQVGDAFEAAGWSGDGEFFQVGHLSMCIRVA